MQFNILLLLSLVLGVSALPAQSPAGKEVFSLNNLEHAWSYAIAHNPDQRIFELNRQRAQSEYKTAKSYLWPQVHGTFTGQINTSLATTPLPGEIFGQPGETITAQFGQEYVYNPGIHISKQFFDWQSNARAKLAGQNIELVATEQEAYEQRLREQVAVYYYTGQVAQAAIAINQKDQQLADSIVLLMEQKFAEGLIDAIALNQSHINANNIQQNLSANQTLWQQCRRQLKDLLGLPSDVRIQLPDLELDAPAMTTAAIALQPDKNLQVQVIHLESAKLSLNLQKTAKLPIFSLNAYYGQQQFRDHFGFSLSGEDWSPYSYISLGVNVPIFTGFANSSKVQTAKIELQIAEEQYAIARRQRANQDELLLRSYQNSLDVVRSTRNNYQLFEANRRLSAQKLQEGLISMDAYFRVFEDYLKAENAYLNALNEMYGHYASIVSRQF